MCDNTAPYTAQEVHLVTTEFKIVDKYTVEYLTVLTEAHSSLKHRKIFKKKTTKKKIKHGIKDQRKPVWHTHGKYIENKARKIMSQRKMRPQRNLLGQD